MRKLNLTCLALLLLLAALAHTQVYPPEDCITTFPAGSCGGAPSPFDDAVSVWTFNDPADLGADSQGTSDLTEVNTPTATGGALGYAADFSPANSLASIADNDSLSGDNSSDIAFCAWTNADLTNNASLANKYDGATLEWLIYGGSGDKICMGVSVNGTVFAGQACTTDDMVEGERTFICGWFDASEVNNPYVSLNVVAPDNSVLSGAIQNTGADFRIARWTGGGATYWDNPVGPAYFWKGALGDFTTVRDSVYNSGKGKTCADLSGAELTNLVSCWEMDENGGPYVDSVASNDLTATNTPTRAAGLVERSDSGMAAFMDAATDPHFKLVDATLSVRDKAGMTVAIWFIRDANNQIILQTAGHQSSQSWTFAANAAPRLSMAYTGGGGACGDATSSDLVSAGEWHLGVGWWDSVTGKTAVSLDNATADVGATTCTVITTDLNANGHFVSSGAYATNNSLDDAAIWHRVLTSSERDTLWSSGAGTFFAAFFDTIFNGPRFAWSKPPEIRRIEL